LGSSTGISILSGAHRLCLSVFAQQIVSVKASIA
jgi:hypothetical protein